MSTVDPVRLKRFMAKKVHLKQGAGKGANGEIDVCVMQAVDWLRGGDGKSDAPPCASNVIGRYCIRLNDSALFAKHRDLLKPYAPKIIGTKANVEVEMRRGFIATDHACRVFIPIAFRATKYDDWAKECEALEPIRNNATARVAEEVLLKIKHAAADAAAYYAAADAADAAYAAYAAAYAAADAAYDAAAYAAADAAYAAAYSASSAAYAAYAASSAAYATYAAAGAYDAPNLRAAALRCLDAMLAVTA